MDKIKVIHFIDRIARGGTQAILYDWLKHIDRDKVQFDFLVFRNGQDEYIGKFKELGCNIYQISPLSIKNVPRFMADLKKFFDEHKYDIAHGHSKSKNVFFLYVAKMHGVPVRIAHSHNTQFQRMALIGEMMKPLLKMVATDFYACSEIAGAWLFGEKALKQGNVSIVKNGVDIEKFRFDEYTRLQYRRELELDDAIVYGHIGKYTEQKNHIFLLEIFAEIKKMQPSAKLLLIGSGTDAFVTAINKRIKELNLDKSVIQLGLRSDVPKLLQAIDVFVLPSLYEGLPVVGVEAQVSGLPLLLSDSITREVKLLDSTQYMSLNKTPYEWGCEAIKLHEQNENKRALAAQMVFNQGYDSKLVIDQLIGLYTKSLNKKV